MAKLHAFLVIFILAASLAFAGCTGSVETGQAVPADSIVVWKDTCEPFECGSESAYGETMAEAYAGIADNMTGAADYSNMSWSSAFLSLNDLMKERYAFTEWRGIDFDALYGTYAPVIAAAEENHDEAAYYRALREYIYSIPDGHVDVIPASGEFGTRDTDIGGSFGIGIIRLDSGKVIVDYVAEESVAADAGISFGDEVIEWNGEDIGDAIDWTSYLWANKKPSTAEGMSLHRQRLLTRAPPGTTAKVILTGSSGETRTVNLTAYDDGYESLKRTSFFLGKEVNDYGVDKTWADVVPQMTNETVAYVILPGGYAYIAVYEESFEVYESFRDAMLSAISNGTPGIVLDLRYNNGGDDNLAACFAGWFVDEPVFYEYTTSYDPGTGEFVTVSGAWSVPQPERYDGPVAVLVSPDTISSGEGVPMIFSKTGRGEIVSWYGTNGAFGMNDVRAIMPLDMYVMFPDGASLDENGIIQVDSDATLFGGVSPGIRVPLNEETVARAAAGEDVQLTYALEWLEEQE